jgi:hypothetical protein
MIMTTKLGKRRRKPSGIEMDELPFNLMRLLKKDNRESVLGFSSFQSADAGGADVAGRRLYSRCTKPMVSKLLARAQTGLLRCFKFVISAACTRHLGLIGVSAV